MLTTVFIPFLIVLLSGVLWGFIPNAPDRATTRSALSSVVLNIFLPALTFLVISRAPLNRELWAVPLASAFACVMVVILAAAVYRGFFRIEKGPVFGTLLLCAAWSNATYLGLPVVTALFGEDLRRVPILYDLGAITPLLLTLGVGIGSRYGTVAVKDRKLGRGGIAVTGLMNVLRLPPFWGLIAGLLCNALAIPIPTFITAACSIASAAVAPMMIFAVGLALGRPAIKHVVWLVPALILKLVAQPLLAWGAASVVGLHGTALSATAVEGAMPTMVLTMVIADRFKLDSPLLAQAIAISTILSFLTIPALMHFISM